MSMIIADGSGSGFKAKVDSLNRLRTSSVTQEVTSFRANLGEAYNINTGTITLSSGSKSAVLYIKNNEDTSVIITGFIYLIGTNTGGSGDALIQIERNPTGGTIVSGANTATPYNRNFGSSRTLLVDSYKGAEGSTLTGGTVVIESIFPSPGRQVIGIESIILDKSNSVGVTVTPPAGTTDQDYQIAVSIYRQAGDI